MGSLISGRSLCVEREIGEREVVWDLYYMVEVCVGSLLSGRSLCGITEKRKGRRVGGRGIWRGKRARLLLQIYYKNWGGFRMVIAKMVEFPERETNSFTFQKKQQYFRRGVANIEKCERHAGRETKKNKRHAAGEHFRFFEHP